MGLDPTHDLDVGGERFTVSTCVCFSCDNDWWVRCGVEFRPSFCPYCGTRFLGYENSKGERFDNLNRPLPEAY